MANTQLAEKAGLAVSRGIVTDRLLRTSVDAIYALGDCAAVEGQIFAFIEPIRRQPSTITAHLIGEQRPFNPQPPLVRVKTPSFPLTACLPLNIADTRAVPRSGAQQGRMDYLLNDRLVGFVLSGEQARSGGDLYRGLYG